MLPLAAENHEFARRRPVQRHVAGVPGWPSVLLATSDPEIWRTMGELLQSCKVNMLSANSIEEIRCALASEDIVACFSGFWLLDGTYRDVMMHLKRQRAEIPAIIVCAPTCPQEYTGYLAALNIRAFDFICYPYSRIDLERILDSAIGLRRQLFKLFR